MIHGFYCKIWVEKREILELFKRRLKMTGTTKNEIGNIMYEMQEARKGTKPMNFLNVH